VFYEFYPRWSCIKMHSCCCGYEFLALRLVCENSLHGCLWTGAKNRCNLLFCYCLFCLGSDAKLFLFANHYSYFELIMCEAASQDICLYSCYLLVNYLHATEYTWILDMLWDKYFTIGSLPLISVIYSVVKKKINMFRKPYIQRKCIGTTDVVCFLLGNSAASEFYMPTFRNALSVTSS
jgi:hypothetical protein